MGCLFAVALLLYFGVVPFSPPLCVYVRDGKYNLPHSYSLIYHHLHKHQHTTHIKQNISTNTTPTMSSSSKPTAPNPNTDSPPVAAAHSLLYEQGLAIRTAVTGASHVQKSLSNATPFTQPIIQYVTETAWGSVWSRPGLDRKTRSLLNIAMLSALGKSNELAVHVRGAINNGASEEEVLEVVLQVTAYCGAPAGMEAARVADGVLRSVREEKAREGEGETKV